ncbi:phage tail protein [Clostridioides difficile]|uniref:phage tail-collar fiber domain-containing protein n=2 Tax=Clostridioides difficile TaxID=1496 RepID=UPI001F2AFC83
MPSSVGGFMIREIGYLDDENNLIAISKYKECYKPSIEQGAVVDMKVKTVLIVSNVNNIASTLGSPFVGTDKLSVTKTKIQTLKNTLAISLSMKNISAQSTETLHSLISKVVGIENIFIAQGECTQVGEKTFQLYQVDNNTPKTCSANAISFNLAFTPKFIIVYRNAYNIDLCSFVFYSSFRNIITAVPQPSNFGEMYTPNTFDCVVGHTCILPVKDYKIPHFFYAIA